METVKEGKETLEDKLLRLIEEGDATVILSSEYTESLNDLIKNEFISIENDALRLTEKGKQAKIIGVYAMTPQVTPGEEQIKKENFPQQKISTGISNNSFLIILFFFLISILAILTLTNS